MPLWASIALTALISGIVTWVVTNTLNGLKERSKKNQGLRKKEYQEATKALVKDVAVEAVAPIAEDQKVIKVEMQDIRKDLAALKEGTQASLRNDLLKCFNHCKSQGYKTKEEMQDFIDMFKAYRGVDGNSFIMELNEEFKTIPLKDTYKK